MDLIERAMRKAKNGKKASRSDVNPLKDAMKEAWDAMKADNFDKFSDAFESAVKIQVADQGEDTADDDGEDDN